MTNKEVYKKTLTFSIKRLVFNVLAFLLLAVLCSVGFIILEKANGKGLIGLLIGLVIGIILIAIASHFVSYIFKAGQIAMMTKAVTENELPDDVYAEGKKIVKERFATVAIFYACTRAIKAIFNQLAKAINALGRAVGGDTGDAVSSAINTAVSILIGFLCDCCLGWVFYRKDKNAAKATCEGAAIFFKHGKTLLKNVGRIFGMGLLSLILIGGAFFGIFYAICTLIPGSISTLAKEIAEAAVRLEITDNGLINVLSNPTYLGLILAGIAALIMFSIIHGAFVRPFILAGVLRNYMESGMNDVPTEDAIASLESKSPRLKKLNAEGL